MLVLVQWLGGRRTGHRQEQVGLLICDGKDVIDHFDLSLKPTQQSMKQTKPNLQNGAHQQWLNQQCLCSGCAVPVLH